MYPVTVDVLSQIFAKYGGMEKVIIFNRGNAIQALVQLRDISTAATCRSQLDGQNVYSGCNSLKVQYSSLAELEVKQNNERMFDFTITQPAFDHYAATPMTEAYQSLGGTSPASFGGMYNTGKAPVLIVAGLNPDLVESEHLAALFAVYGNVIRVKMIKGRDSALVQLNDLDQCKIAQEFLDGVVLFGESVKVEMSKGGSIPPPHKVQEEGDDSVKEYSAFPLLYARHKSDKPHRLFVPSNSLHISNMPDGTTEEQLTEVLTNGGADITYMRFLDNQNHIAIVVCSTVENAIETLVKCHAALIGTEQSRPMRIGFGHSSAALEYMAQQMDYYETLAGYEGYDEGYYDLSGLYDPVTGAPAGVQYLETGEIVE
jgi:RNA recognition motif-containing protein